MPTITIKTTTAAGLLALVSTLTLAAIPASAAASEDAAAAGSDLAKEARWRAQIVDSLMDGDAVDLTADGVTFLGLYTEADEDTGRAAVIVHGIGVHPNWPQVVYPLRTALPGAGWSTLSVQMPVLPNEAADSDYAPLMADAAPRLDAAVAYLQEQGAERVAIIAHSLGASMANAYVAEHADAVDAYVAVGMSSGESHAGQDNNALVGKIAVPVLDLFGENDLDAVIGGAPARAESGGAGNSGYHQVQVPGADHFFDGHEDALTETVVEWLDETIAAP
ncbi:MAG: alpha/beta hydrolase family protein [Thiohalocapsa sp.]|nr:alpha/beta hydrolase family protein [Thiohalocapsa sp.]